MDPDSNHPSRTSGVRSKLPPQSHGYSIASRYSLWRSFTECPARFSISAIDPRTSRFLHFEHSQTGIGVAQYRLREMFQSRAFSSDFLKLPSLMVSGYHPMFLLSSLM